MKKQLQATDSNKFAFFKIGEIYFCNNTIFTSNDAVYEQGLT